MKEPGMYRITNLRIITNDSVEKTKANWLELIADVVRDENTTLLEYCELKEPLTIYDFKDEMTEESRFLEGEIYKARYSPSMRFKLRHEVWNGGLLFTLTCKSDHDQLHNEILCLHYIGLPIQRALIRRALSSVGFVRLTLESENRLFQLHGIELV